MKKDEFIRQVTEAGDAVITYRSQNSRRLKYNVCTLDFDNKYIQSKRNQKTHTETSSIVLLGYRFL